MKSILPKKFFERPVAQVAENLLGAVLVRATRGKVIHVLITETEGYDGPRDRACHASRGYTRRTKVMFGPAGSFYVYLCYGMYWMLNVVTGPEGYPAAVLIRGGVAAFAGGENSGFTDLCGPGKLTRALEIDGKLNAYPANKESGLWIEKRGIIVPSSAVKKTPRIGVSYAGSYWSRRKLRFVLDKDTIPH